MSFGFFEKYSILRDVEKTIEILYHPTPFLRRRYCVYTRHADFACTVYTRSSVYLMLLHAHQNRLPRFVFKRTPLISYAQPLFEGFLFIYPLFVDSVPRRPSDDRDVRDLIYDGAHPGPTEAVVVFRQ